MSTADIGNGCACFQLLAHASQRGNPVRCEVGQIARAEETLGAPEQAGMMVAQRMPSPLRNISATCSSSLTSEMKSSNPPATNNGFASSANAARCSGVKEYAPVAGLYSI